MEDVDSRSRGTLRVGMTRDAVLQMLGKPSSVEARTNGDAVTDVWTYVRRVKGPPIVKMGPHSDWSQQPMLFDTLLKETVEIEFVDNALTVARVSRAPDG
jgi:outer membrane protein assembly factor BamE (lipoprotein component of BamABCDE complex)